MDLPYVPSMMSVLATTNIISDVLKHKTMEELNRNSKLKQFPIKCLPTWSLL